MGFLKDLFNPPQIPLAPDIPEINTVLTQSAIDNILRGHLVSIPVKRLIMKKNEECYFCDYAILINEKLRVIAHKRYGGGFSFRIVKGLYYRVGDGHNLTIRDKVQDYTKGKLYITNQRIVFSADNMAFQKSIKDLITYREEDNCIILQFSKGSYKLFIPIPTCAEKVLEKIL